MDADGCISSPNFAEGLQYDMHGCTIQAGLIHHHLNTVFRWKINIMVNFNLSS